MFQGIKFLGGIGVMTANGRMQMRIKIFNATSNAQVSINLIKGFTTFKK